MSREQETTPVNVDRWLARGGGAGMLGILMFIWQSAGGMRDSMEDMRLDISQTKEAIVKITTELELVSPQDIRRDLTLMNSQMLTESDVQRIISTSAPWVAERNDILSKIDDLNDRVEELEAR